MRLRFLFSAFFAVVLMAMAGCSGSNDITGNVYLHTEPRDVRSSENASQGPSISPQDDWIIANEVVVSFTIPDASATTDAVVKTLGALRVLHSGLPGFAVYRFPGANEASEARSRLEVLPGIKSVEPNYRVTALGVSEPIPDSLWNLSRIHLPESRSISSGSPEVIVAVIDTGFLTTHPDLENVWTSPNTWWDFVGNDPDPSVDNPGGNSATHGTHVAGIIASQLSTSMVGVAPNVKLLPIRALNDYGIGDLSMIAAAVNWAVDHGANIINMSVGSQYSSGVLDIAIANAHDHGVTIVAAAGNDGYRHSPNMLYPARLGAVISVGAVDSNNWRASFSSYGPELDLMAPGVEYYYSDLVKKGIYSTVIGADGQPGYGYLGGTSISCPHVTGIAALLASSGIKSPDEIRFWLENTATDLGRAGCDDQYGHGLVNAYSALALPRMRISVRPVSAGPAAVTGLPESSPSSSGRFILKDMPEGEWVLWAWVDSNGNGLVDPPDSFGEYPAPLLVPGTRYRDLPLIVDILQ